ncbi:MAG TPA: hypothetical protein DEA08_29945 [Planctomycetes bacterium]|nr:hypothetical protein [Planctomycetota bacterium]
MLFKALYGASLGLMGFMLLFMAPNGRGLVTSASPDKVERQAPSAPNRGTTTRTRGPRYIWAGGYSRGK